MHPGVLDLVGARRGHFADESGFHGALWLDLDRLFADPARLRPLTGELAERVAVYEPEVLRGLMSGGAFLAYKVAASLRCGFVWTERRLAAEAVRYELPDRLREAVRGRPWRRSQRRAQRRSSLVRS